jgi:hypothetical protein
MNNKTYLMLRDIPCQVDYGLGNGWQPRMLREGLDYIVSDLVIAGDITSFSLWDGKGFIGDYKVATAEFQQHAKECQTKA